VLILLDNHQSHLDIKVLDLAKEHGVVMSVYGPFTKCVNSASEARIGSNHGKL